jgi:hypothetical protein
MRLKILPCLAALGLAGLAIGPPHAVASPLARTNGATAAVVGDVTLVQSDDSRRRRSRSGDGVYTGGRSGGGDGVYTGGRSGGGDGVYTGGRGGDGVYRGSRSRGGDGVYTGGRSRGDGVYTGGQRSRRGEGVYRGGNQGTVFCNPQLGCVRDLNINPGSGLR